MITQSQIPNHPAPDATDEAVFEASLRPFLLSEYVGQEQIKQNLNIAISAAKIRGEAVEHVLLYGPPGLGKTTLANIIAKETGRNLKITSGATIQKSGDLAAVLSNLENGDVLFIDEIHRLPPTAEEILYPAIEDGVLDIMVGKGPGARSLRLQLPPFTLVGATTRIGLISSPLRDRFGHVFHLEYYGPEEIIQILRRASNILKIGLAEAAAEEIANRSRGTPRIANRLLRRVRDFVQIQSSDKINLSDAQASLSQLGVDTLGLESGDRLILETVMDKFAGGPVGLGTLAIATGEAEDTITDIYEPFLIRQGLLVRTSKGRQTTPRAYSHLNKHPSKSLI